MMDAAQRMDTIEKMVLNKEFVKTAAKGAKKMGVTSEEWNGGCNMPILILFANRLVEEGKHEQFL